MFGISQTKVDKKLLQDRVHMNQMVKIVIHMKNNLLDNMEALLFVYDNNLIE